MELLILTGFMFLIFVAVLGFGGRHLISLQRDYEQSLAIETADFLENELTLALEAEEGYVREFKLPAMLGRHAYEIEIFEAGNFTEVVIGFVNTSFAFEKTVLVPRGVSGDIDVAAYDNEVPVRIRKEYSGNVSIQCI